jgi:hypothetical protein
MRFTRDEQRAARRRSEARVLVVCDRAGHARMRAQAFVARVRHGDALWVHEHTVMYMREIHHIAFELG